MPDNRETFSFDASQAIAELGRLATAVEQVTKDIAAFNNTTAKTSSKALFNAGKAHDDLYKNISTRTKEAAQETAKLTTRTQQLGIQWKSVGKLIAGDLIRRGVFELRDAFFAAADAAQEFQLRVARIDAIVKDLNFDQISQQILDLSSALARPVDEVGEALFEAFQNDLGTTAETLEIVSGAANDLALITGGSLVQAVNAISSAVKGYNLDVDEAQEVSAIFFQAIDSGRVTLDELESSLGKVVGIASAAGVDLRNISAAVATITLSGTDANVAFTQLRNVLNKAVKPTKELRGALDELGVRSFAQLVERSGNLRNALQEIFDQLDRDPERFARAFNTIRGQLGAINILLESDAGSEFNRILNETEGAAERLKTGLEGIRDTDAFRAQEQAAEFNKILTELGDTALKVKVELSDALLTVVPDANAAGGAIAGLTLAVGAYAATWALVPAAVVGAFPIALMTATGVAIGLLLNLGINKLIDGWSGVAEATEKVEAASADLEFVKAAELQKLEELEQSLGDVDDALLGVGKESKDAFNAIKLEAEKAGRAIATIFSDAVDVFASQQKSLLSSVESAIADIDSKFRESVSSLRDAQLELADFDFERGLEGLNEGTKQLRIQARATEALSKARRTIAEFEQGNATREEVDAAIDLAKEYGKASVSNAKRLKDTVSIKKAQDNLREVLLDQEKIAQRTRNELSETRAKNLREDFLETSEASAKLVDQSKLIQQLLSTTDADGLPKSTAQLEEDLSRARLEQEKFIKDSEAFQGIQLFKDLDLQTQAASVVTTFQNAIEKATVDWTSSLDRLAEQLQGRQFEANVRFVEQAADAAKGTQLEDEINNVTKQGGSSVEQQGAINQILSDAVRTQAQLNSELTIGETEFRKIQTTVEQTRAQLNGWAFFTGRPSEEVREYTSLIAGIASTAGTAGQEAASQLKVSLSDTFKQIREDNKDGIIPNERFVQLQTLFDQTTALIAQRLQNLSTQGQLNPALIQDVEKVQSAAEDLNQETIKIKTDAAQVDQLNLSVSETAEKGKEASLSVASIGPSASNGVGPASNLASTVGSIAEAARNSEGAVDSLISKLQNAINLQGQLDSGPVNAYRGGQVNYRADGGTGRGQDTIAARLSPGEFVVNSQASRNFFSQLQSINAGSTSASGGEGGGNTTINVGDINVNTSSQLPNQTAREVGQSLQREIRRRTFRL